MQKVLRFNLGIISKYRDELMGAATIGILMCHAPHYGVNLPFHLNSLLGIGQMGVLLFFFLSGVGMYYSTQKLENTAKSVGIWYKKRFVKLLIPYIIIYGLALCILTGRGGCGFTLREYLYRLSTLSYWSGDGGVWFVDVLIPLYLMTPLWKTMLDKIKFPIIPTIIVMGIMVFADTPFKGHFFQASFFFFGFWMAKYIKEERIISGRQITLFCLVIACLLAIYYFVGVGYLLAIMILPSILIFCVLVNKCKCCAFNSILRFFGSISLESYLFNVTLIVWIDYFQLLPDSLYPYRYAFIVVFGVVLSWLTKKLCRPIIVGLSK